MAQPNTQLHAGMHNGIAAAQTDDIPNSRRRAAAAAALRNIDLRAPPGALGPWPYGSGTSDDGSDYSSEDCSSDSSEDGSFYTDSMQMGTDDDDATDDDMVVSANPHPQRQRKRLGSVIEHCSSKKQQQPTIAPHNGKTAQGAAGAARQRAAPRVVVDLLDDSESDEQAGVSEPTEAADGAAGNYHLVPHLVTPIAQHPLSMAADPWLASGEENQEEAPADVTEDVAVHAPHLSDGWPEEPVHFSKDITHSSSHDQESLDGPEAASGPPPAPAPAAAASGQTAMPSDAQQQLPLATAAAPRLVAAAFAAQGSRTVAPANTPMRVGNNSATDVATTAVAPQLVSGWTEVKGGRCKLQITKWGSGKLTIPSKHRKMMNIPSKDGKTVTEGQQTQSFQVDTKVFKDGRQLGHNLLCDVDKSDKITLDKTTVESVVDCMITKLRAKAPNVFEVYFVTQPATTDATSQGQVKVARPEASAARGTTPAATAPAATAPAATAVALDQTPVVPQVPATVAPAASAAQAPPPSLVTASVVEAPSPNGSKQSPQLQAVTTAAPPATGNNNRSAGTGASSACDANPLASTTTAAAAVPLSTNTAVPQGAQLPDDFVLEPYEGIPQAVNELTKLLRAARMKAPKEILIQLRRALARLGQLNADDQKVLNFKAGYELLRYMWVEYKDTEEVWSALCDLLRTE